MRRMMALLLAALLLSAAGCAAPVAAPAPTPLPTPTPVGMQRIFGKDVTIACDSADGDWFAEGVRAQAQELGVPVVWVENGEAAGDGMIVSCAEEPITASVPVIYHAASGTDAPAIPDGCVGVLYDGGDAAAIAIQAMYAYPSHEAPVRALGMFGEPNGKAHEAYLAMASQGKLQDKGMLVLSDGALASIQTQVEPWLRDALSGIAPGRLDTVFTDGSALALRGFEALKEAKRGDAVEICALGLLPAQVAAMLEDHFLMGTAVGKNQYGAGRLAVRMLLCAMAGERIKESYTLSPLCVSSDEVLALYRAGNTDVNEILEALDTETEQAYQADFFEELRENHTA